MFVICAIFMLKYSIKLPFNILNLLKYYIFYYNYNRYNNFLNRDNNIRLFFLYNIFTHPVE